MMIDFALDAERKRGKTSREAILRGMPDSLPADHDDDDGGAARRDTAHASARGPGAELRRPLGISIVGGLIVSQMLTFYTTPVVYLYLDRFRLWCLSLMDRKRPAAYLAGEETGGVRL